MSYGMGVSLIEVLTGPSLRWRPGPFDNPQNATTNAMKTLSRQRRIRRLQFECMERREALSGFTGAAAAVGQMSLPLRATPFQLSGSGVSGGQTTAPDGKPAMLNVAEGQATWLGQFRGQLLLEHSQGANTGVILGNLVGDNGAILRMTFYGIGGNGPNSVIQGRYFITGGAGSLAGATGSGRFVGIPDTNGNHFTFAMQGQIVT